MLPASARDAGMVTVEAALALPTVLVMAAVGVGAVGLGIDHARCVDAAAAAARHAARGESAGDAVAWAARAAPEGSAVAVSVAGGIARAEVRAPPRAVLAWLPGVPVASGSASVRVEQ